MFDQSNSIPWKEVFGTKELPPLDFVIEGLLAGTVGAIIAPGATGKSFYGLELCIAIAVKDLLGSGIDSCGQKSIYVTAEDPREILFARAHEIAKHLSEDEKGRVEELVKVFSLQGSFPCLLNAKGQVDAECQKNIDELKGVAKGSRLMVIDTLRRFHAAEENDSGHMTRVLQILEEIAKESGCAIIYTHHTSKAAAQSGNGEGQFASRGSGSISDNIRFQVNLVAMTSSEAKEFGVKDEETHLYVKAVEPKTNYTKGGRSYWLKRTEGGVLVSANLKPKTKAKGKAKTNSRMFEVTE